MSSWGVRIGVVCVVLLALLAGVGLSLLSGDTIRSGVWVDGVNVSGMTIEQAKSKLAPVADRLAEERVVLRYGGESFDTSLGDIGGTVDISASIQAAHRVGREGNVLQQVGEILSTRRNGRRIPVSYAFDKDRAFGFLKTAAGRIDRKPMNAGLVVKGEQVSITPHKPGIRLDLEKSLRQLQQAVNSGERDIKLVVVTANPTVIESDLSGINGVVASYSTSYKSWERDRTHNLKMACQAINGTLLRPGEIFSYNRVVGPRTQAAGFRNAPMFVDGQVEPGLGGGVCQVSTTLYNAALLADMQIVRRAHHSRPVVYAPVGRDATVSPVQDFRFKNASDAPVYIMASVGPRTVDIKLLGATESDRTVELVSVGHKVIGAGVKRIIAEDIEPGKTVVKEPGRAGHKVSIYRVVKQSGEVVKRELISNDYYRPESRVIATSKPTPKPAPEPTEM